MISSFLHRCGVLSLSGKAWFSRVSLVWQVDHTGQSSVSVAVVRAVLALSVCINREMGLAIEVKTLVIPSINTNWVLDTQLYLMFNDLAFPVQALSDKPSSFGGFYCWVFVFVFVGVCIIPSLSFAGRQM